MLIDALEPALTEYPLIPLLKPLMKDPSLTSVSLTD